MKIINPVKITDGMVLDFVGLGQTTRLWQGMCAALSDGDIYCSVYAGYIYKRAAGAGNFSAEYSFNKNWYGMAADPVTGDIYAAVYGGDVWVQTAGAGAFAAIAGTDRNWTGVCVSPTGVVYASAYGGDIYYLSGGAWTGMAGTNRNWMGMAAAPNGDIYASVYGGDIYKRTLGAGTFDPLSQTTRLWQGMCAAPNGDVFAIVWYGDIYCQYGGSGNFVPMNQTLKSWTYGTVASNGDMYLSGYDVYYRPSGSVSENDYAEWAVGTTYGDGDTIIVTKGNAEFISLDQGVRSWQGMCAASDLDIYSAVDGGDIYKQALGTGNFIALSQTSRRWQGMAASPIDNDVYATVYGGDIYKQTSGAGSFAAQTAGNKSWTGICINPINDDTYACVYGGSIWKSDMGAGAFNDLVAGNKNWVGMTSSLGGNIYACVYGGSIWMQSAGAGAFNDLSQTPRNWNYIAASPNGDIYATVWNGDIYKQTAGAGDFVALSQTTRKWQGIAIDINRNIYVNGFNETIYKSLGDNVHHIYESLVAGNVGNYPPTDAIASTPKWLDMGATNKWLAFDNKTTKQTTNSDRIVYRIKPGIAINSIVLLNLVAGSVTIAAGAYTTTIVSGATDIVDMSLPAATTDTITVTIINLSGPAKVGEIVIGNYSTLGTFRPDPSVSITDYSKKEVDAWGNYSVVEGDYAKRMSCSVKIANTLLDTVFNLLASYRSTPLVWIGSTNYSSTIVYGYYRDFSIVIGYKDYSMCSLEIEGLT